MVDSDEDYFLWEIQKMLAEKTYKIEADDYRTQIINDKWKERELRKLNYYPHRIVQWAIMLQLEPIFMQVLCNHTCASLKNRGIHYAYRLMNKYLKDEENTKYCLKIDIKKFYPSINHKILKQLLRRKIKDNDVLEMLDMIIDSYPWEKGVPIGSYLSQYLANYYLAYFDHWLKEEMKSWYVVRYMDDIIVLSDNKSFLHDALKQIQNYLSTLELEVKGNYQVFPVESRWIDFVWYRFFHNFILLRKWTCKRMKRKLKKIKEEKTDRHKLLNYSERCSINSYIWWVLYCNHHRLYYKYIKPLIRSLTSYYYFVITNKKTKSTYNYYLWILAKQY